MTPTCYTPVYVYTFIATVFDLNCSAPQGSCVWYRSSGRNRRQASSACQEGMVVAQRRAATVLLVQQAHHLAAPGVQGADDAQDPAHVHGRGVGAELGKTRD